MTVQDKRFGVKINAGAAMGGNPCIYHNSGFPFQGFIKWRWYFNYRAALYQVNNPRHSVDLFTFSYDYVPTSEQQAKALKDKIQGKKAQITRWENSIRIARREWNELFPIEEFPFYIKAMEKIRKHKNDLSHLENT